MQQKDEKKKENEPARENMNGARADRRWGGVKRKRPSKSSTFRGINAQTSPGISKGAPDSKLFKPTVQSGDTSIRISNCDGIDRPTAAERKLGRC